LGTGGGRPVSAAIGLTPLLPLLGLLPGGRWLLPLVAPLTVYPEFAQRVRRGDAVGAFRIGLVWALLLSLGVVALVAVAPVHGPEAILHGADYQAEMMGWVRTGQAPENDWHQFLPQHLLHLGAFVLLTWVSGGYLGLCMGALLVDYMSAFVSAYAAASRHPLIGVAAAWVPWSVMRVLAFVLLGALLARPLLVRRWWPYSAADRRLLLLALSGIATDLLVKFLCAPGYGRLLKSWLK
jgi:hypothetical protein